MNPYFTDYSEYLGRFFPGQKVQKISVNTGASCPNRDGYIGKGGCIYCNNASFTPSYCLGENNLLLQIEKGKAFFGRKYKDMKYLVYFQSYTNTYRISPDKLRNIYEKALRAKDVVGLVIGTRPDCLPDDVVEILSEINKYHPVFVELGVETLCDETLLLINRGHDASTAKDAIKRLAENGLHTGVHLIAGLPGENKERVLETIDEICRLPVESLKIHQLQILKGTALHELYKSGKIKITPYSMEEYLELCVNITKRVPRRISIDRFLASSPPNMVVSPKWGLKNYEFTNKLLNLLEKQVVIEQELI